MEATQKLTNIQRELLKVFSLDLSEKQMEEIRALLLNYFSQNVTADFDSLFETEGWGDEKIEEWSKEHMRIPSES